jgi:hypothetical protein
MRERLQWQKNPKFIYNIKFSGTLIVHKTRSKFALCEFKLRFKPSIFGASDF